MPTPRYAGEDGIYEVVHKVELHDKDLWVPTKVFYISDFPPTYESGCWAVPKTAYIHIRFDPDNISTSKCKRIWVGEEACKKVKKILRKENLNEEEKKFLEDLTLKLYYRWQDE